MEIFLFFVPPSQKLVFERKHEKAWEFVWIFFEKVWTFFLFLASQQSIFYRSKIYFFFLYLPEQKVTAPCALGLKTVVHTVKFVKGLKIRCGECTLFPFLFPTFLSYISFPYRERSRSEAGEQRSLNKTQELVFLSLLSSFSWAQLFHTHTHIDTLSSLSFKAKSKRLEKTCV